MNRWAVAAAAIVTAAGVVVVTAAVAVPDARRLAVELGVLACLLLAGAVAWQAALLAPALVALAGVPAFSLVDHGSVTGPVVAAAALLLATGELAGWSIDLRSAAPESRAVRRDRAVATVALAAGAAVVATGVLAASGLPAPGGVLPELVGLGALLAVISFAALRKW